MQNLDLRTLLEDLVSSLRCLAAVQNGQSKLCAVLVYEGHEMIRGQELQPIGKEAIVANEKKHSFTLHTGVSVTNEKPHLTIVLLSLPEEYVE